MKKATIYTRSGDTGTTSLIGGTRVPKDHLRVETYGTIDELNAHLGVLATLIPEHPQCSVVERIENTLFSVGVCLADEKCDSTPDIEQELASLEKCIDAMEATLPPIKAFLLPGGNRASAQANLCRTVCRRAERRLTTLSHECEIPQTVYAYINRVSDYLFTLSRLLNDRVEKKWEKCWK